MGNKTLTIAKEMFQSKEICNIIKVCSEAGVVELKFGGLEVKFGGASLPSPKKSPAELGFQGKEAYQISPQKSVLPDSNATSQKMDLIDKQVLEDLERTNLLLEDPLAYEQMIFDEHLTGNAGTDASRSGFHT